MRYDMARSRSQRRLILMFTTLTLTMSVAAFAADSKDAPAVAPTVRTDGESVSVGVAAKFSTWSDVTALFRPSRWRNPLAAGGTISWLNPRSWRDEPGRTAKVLLGEAVVVGAVVAVSTSGGGGGDGDDDKSPAGNPKPADGTTGATHKAFNSLRLTTATWREAR